MFAHWTGKVVVNEIKLPPLERKAEKRWGKNKIED